MVKRVNAAEGTAACMRFFCLLKLCMRRATEDTALNKAVNGVLFFVSLRKFPLFLVWVRQGTL